MLLSSARATIGRNSIIFRVNGRDYLDNLEGDNVLNIFNRNLMNTYLLRYEDELGVVRYDDIIQLSVIENRDERIVDFPHSLQVLTIMNSVCSEIAFPEQSKRHLKFIHINKTNLTAMPNIDGCQSLEVFKVNFANIGRFNITYELPGSLREFNLQNNSLTNDQFNYGALQNLLQTSPSVKINLSYNKLNMAPLMEILKGKGNVHHQHIYKYIQVTFRNVGEENALLLLAQNTEINRGQAPRTNTTILNSSQTVHLTSVNNSVEKSVQTIRKYIQDNNIRIYPLDDWNISILSDIYYYVFPYTQADSIKLFRAFMKKHANMTGFIWEKFACMTKNTMTGMTYKQTFELVWSVFNHKVNMSRDMELLDRLYIELADSVGKCFTGVYNRLINSLVGILEGVQVGISTREEMQLEFGRLVANLTKEEITEETFGRAVCGALEILRAANMLEEKNVWLGALYGYAPANEEHEIEGIVYEKNWENMLFHKNSEICVGAYDEENNEYVFFHSDGMEEKRKRVHWSTAASIEQV